MAVATITSTSYGYRCTGGNSETTVSTGKLRVKNIVLIPASNGDSAVFKDVSGNAIHTMKGVTAGTSYNDFFGDVGTVFNNMTVTLTGATDVVHIHLV